MSQIIKPVMLDETGQTANQKLEALKSTVNSGDEAKVAKLLQIAEALESVHSVNGMTGDVVIDATNVPLDKLNNPKTIAQVLSEEQTAVNNAVNEMESDVTTAINKMVAAQVPVDFSASEIENDDYLLTISLEEV